jgi:excinuclease ABC subunit B
MSRFELVSDFKPTGDQPDAIEKLAEGIHKGHKHQVLLGATGTGKTYVVASIVERVQRPTLVICHNKTLAAQLYSEYKSFFPNNAVEYFVSYYDYYQPEAYIPRTDTYIEKDSDINEEIERLRLATMASVFSRRDVIVVASVSCIYALGNPQEWGRVVVVLKRGDVKRRDGVLRHLVDIQYERNDMELRPGRFRVRGDTLEVMPAYSETVFRVEFFGDEIDRISEIELVTGQVLRTHEQVSIYPAKPFVTPEEQMDRAIRDIEAELAERLDDFRKNDKLDIDGLLSRRLPPGGGRKPHDAATSARDV